MLPDYALLEYFEDYQKTGMKAPEEGKILENMGKFYDDQHKRFDCQSWNWPCNWETALNLDSSVTCAVRLVV